MLTHTIVHYAEIGIKGKNRPFFEKKLVNNIKRSIGKVKVERLPGRILVHSADAGVLSLLKNVFGVSHFSPCVVAEKDIKEIKKTALKVLPKRKGISFKVEASRADKSFHLTSMQVGAQVGDAINNKTKWKVDLTKPDLTVFVEIADKAYVYAEKIPGPGGLPVGATGKVVCLLSGGIDSPVAAWYAMKRGCRVVFVHFHTYTSKIDRKIEDLVKILSRYQNSSRLYIVPFYESQEEIIGAVPSKFRMLVYRKMMLRIAEEILKKEEALAFITGDSLAQVASQTLENLNVIYAAANYPVFSPLIGFDKKEIVKQAENIGTYSSSIVPYKDCCSFLVVNPATRAKREHVERHESKVNTQKLVEDAMKRIEVRDIISK